MKPRTADWLAAGAAVFLIFCVVIIAEAIKGYDL